MRTIDILPRFTAALGEQLLEDEARWGNTFEKRGRAGQEMRIFARFDAYYDQFKNGGKPIPWLKVAGLALIGWWREQKDAS